MLGLQEVRGAGIEARVSCIEGRIRAGEAWRLQARLARHYGRADPGVQTLNKHKFGTFSTFETAVLLFEARTKTVEGATELQM